MICFFGWFTGEYIFEDDVELLEAMVWHFNANFSSTEVHNALLHRAESTGPLGQLMDEQEFEELLEELGELQWDIMSTTESWRGGKEEIIRVRQGHMAVCQNQVVVESNRLSNQKSSTSRSWGNIFLTLTIIFAIQIQIVIQLKRAP